MHSKRIMITKPEQNEHKLFYSSDGEHKKALIGHLRVDFGSGDEFWHSWWGEHEEINDDEFSDTLDHIFRTMRKHIFRDRESMRVYLKNLPTGQLDESQGFKAECNGYDFYIRCNPNPGNYDCYCYCYEKELLEQAMSGQDESDDIEMGGM